MRNDGDWSTPRDRNCYEFISCCTCCSDELRNADVENSHKCVHFELEVDISANISFTDSKAKKALGLHESSDIFQVVISFF